MSESSRSRKEHLPRRSKIVNPLTSGVGLQMKSYAGLDYCLQFFGLKSLLAGKHEGLKQADYLDQATKST